MKSDARAHRPMPHSLGGRALDLHRLLVGVLVLSLLALSVAASLRAPASRPAWPDAPIHGAADR